jgi:hypothetical protein
MKLLLALALLCSHASAATHGLSLDLTHGIGYTIYGDYLWAGISLHASKGREFEDNQLVLSPRVYANYNFYTRGAADFFAGASYSDDFGMRRDSTTDKHRLGAVTLGLATKLNEQFRLAAWVNAWGVRDDLIYDEPNGTRYFAFHQNRQSFMDFGGLLLTYVF